MDVSSDRWYFGQLIFILKFLSLLPCEAPLFIGSSCTVFVVANIAFLMLYFIFLSKGNSQSYVNFIFLSKALQLYFFSQGHYNFFLY